MLTQRLKGHFFRAGEIVAAAFYALKGCFVVITSLIRFLLEYSTAFPVIDGLISTRLSTSQTGNVSIG